MKRLAILSVMLTTAVWAQVPKNNTMSEYKVPWLDYVSDESCNTTLAIDSAPLATLVAQSHITDPSMMLKSGELPITADEVKAASSKPHPIFTKKLLSWVPSALPREPNKSDCSADTLESTLRANANSAHARQQFIQDFFSRCDSYLTRNAPPFWWSLLQLDNTDYNFCGHPRIRKVNLHLPDGRHLAAWLALKDSKTPRPLVIAKCGIFCNPGGPSQRFLLMHLFDESPFHVLLLANGTGNQFVRDNHYLEFGGMDEGMELWRVADLMTQKGSPFSHMISSTHVTTVSLGSHAGLYSALYNSFNRHERPAIQSVTALCPVVNLGETFQENFKADGMRTRALSYVVWSNMVAATPFIPQLSEMLPSRYWFFKPQNIPSLMASLAMDDYKRRPTPWLIEPFTKFLVSLEPSFWEANRLTDFHNQVQTPVYILASQDDPVVPVDINAQRLAGENQVNEHGAAFQVNVVPQGSHCAISTTYGWDISSSLLRGQILSEATEFDSSPRTVELAPLPERFHLQPTERFVSQSWEYGVGTNSLLVTLDIADTPDARTGRCRASCERSVVAPIALNSLGLPRATTEVQAQAFTRWANTNLRLTDENHRPLSELRAPPTHIVVKTPF